MARSTRCRSSCMKSRSAWAGVLIATGIRRSTCGPRRTSTNLAWEPPFGRSQHEYGLNLKNVQDSSPGTMLGMPPMNDRVYTIGQTDGGPTGKMYWRSLDDLAGSPPFANGSNGFPQSMRELLAGGVDRRRFLQLMAASMGLAGLAVAAGRSSGPCPTLAFPKRLHRVCPITTPPPCRGPDSNPCSGRVPRGKAHQGRGQPQASRQRGRHRHAAQALSSICTTRTARPVLHAGQASSWDAYDTWAREHYAAGGKGKGLHILSEDLASPSFDLLREHLRSVMPDARWYIYEPISPTAKAGAVLAFGSALAVRPQLDRAEVMLALDCDFLGLEEDGGRNLRASPSPTDRGARPDEPAVRRREPVLANGRNGRPSAPARRQPGPRLCRGPGQRAAPAERAATAEAESLYKAVGLKRSGAVEQGRIREVAADLKAHTAGSHRRRSPPASAGSCSGSRDERGPGEPRQDHRTQERASEQPRREPRNWLRRSRRAKSRRWSSWEGIPRTMLRRILSLEPS